MSDLPGTLDRMRTDLAGPRGRKRVDALLSADDAEAAVGALTVPELFELVAQVGLDDCVELVGLATPAQFQGCLDLEIWDRDRPLTEGMKPWLTVLIEAGYEKVAQVWGGLDTEIRALFLMKQAKIFDLTLGQEPDEDAKNLYFTPDRFFALELWGDENQMRLIKRLLEDLYQSDQTLARHTLMTAHSEPPPELEEMAYRWRSGRMADLGFVDFHEALDLFQPLEVEKVTIGENSADRLPTMIDDEEPRRLPITIAEAVVGRNFLARALDLVDGEDATRLQSALLMLTNKVLSAARIKHGDLDAVRRGAHYATSTASLGLEVVARGDLERAAAALRTVSLTRLHRVGFTVSLKLAKLARALAPRAGTAGDPAGPVLDALVGARPWMPKILDTPPAAGVRPFESPADIRKVAEVLARLGLRIAVAEAIGVDLIAMAQAPEPRPALDDHARTALVRAMLGERLSTAALDEDTVRRFRARCLQDGALTDAAIDLGQAVITRALAGAPINREPLAALVAGWLGDLERSLGHLDDRHLDLRFVDGVVTQIRKD